jgi:threonine dehydratase
MSKEKEITMSVSLEFAPSVQNTVSGDEAFEIINEHRNVVEERFVVDPLEAEFPRFAQHLGRDGVWLARADDNLAGAFKWRGAIVGATKLQEQGHDSLVVPSAGNHARGAILAAKILGMNIHVVVPETAPPAKKEGLKELWNDPRLTVHAVGATFDESLEWALANPQYGELLHPYDDPNVIAGQGTVIDDIVVYLRRMGRLDLLKAVVAATGGGGLAKGMADRLEELGLNNVTTYSAEGEGNDSASRSMRQGERVAASGPNPRFGGSAVRVMGEHAFKGYNEHGDKLATIPVSTDEVDVLTEDYETDRHDLMRDTTPSYEPTSLVGVAAVKWAAELDSEGDIVVIGTGHNAPLWTPKKRVLHPTNVWR